MGRKGVSKRKLPKSKAPTASSGSTNGTVSSILRVSESPVVQSFGKNEAASTGKGKDRKKK